MRRAFAYALEVGSILSLRRRAAQKIRLTSALGVYFCHSFTQMNTDFSAALRCLINQRLGGAIFVNLCQSTDASV